MHSFTGSPETATACLDLGFYISFAGMLTYKKNDDLRSVAREIPLERLLIETDSPYLSPEPLRGKRNEPANVQHTVTRLAQVRGMTADEMAIVTTRNAELCSGYRLERFSNSCRHGGIRPSRTRK